MTLTSPDLLTPGDIEVFWRHVDHSGGPDACWPWNGARDQKGYGMFGRRGTSYRAHRVASYLTDGPILLGLYILHRCDNPPCCNPRHLTRGTQGDNMRDMVTKGRNPDLSGPRNGQTKVTEAIRLAIVETYAAGRLTQAAVGRLFGVSQSTVSKVL